MKYLPSIIVSVAIICIVVGGIIIFAEEALAQPGKCCTVCTLEDECVGNGYCWEECWRKVPAGTACMDDYYGQVTCGFWCGDYPC